MGEKAGKKTAAAGEWYEDAESDAEWIEGRGILASSSLTISNFSYDQLIEANTMLNGTLTSAEASLEQCLAENEKLKAQLSVEKRKSLKLQKKLKYIQDNQQIFSRLKQAYLSMKYNESAGRGLTEIKETSSQTWDGIICESCLKTAEYKAQKDFENLCKFRERMLKENNKEAVDDIFKTIAQIKTLVEKREKTNILREQKEQKHIEIIGSLERQNNILQELLQSKHLAMYPFEMPEKLTTEDNAGFMKKIIFKQEKRLREMFKYNQYRKYTISPLNDMEKEFVDSIVAEHLKKTGKKSTTNLRCRSCDREPRTELVPFVKPEEVLDQLILNRDSGDFVLVDSTETTNTL